MNRTLQIIAWNANGLVQRKQILDDLLHNENINIALILEINFTSWNLTVNLCSVDLNLIK